MTYKPLREAIAARDGGSRSVSTTLSASGGLLPPGTHNVTIVSVDMGHLATAGRIVLQLEDANRCVLDSSLWPIDDRDGRPRLSRPMVNLLNALFSSTDAHDLFAKYAGELDELVFNLFRGLKVRVDVRAGDGYAVHVMTDGTYSVVDALTSTPLLGTLPPFAKVGAAHDAARAAGLRRSFNRVYRYEEITNVTADNLNAFKLAYQAISDLRRGSSAGPVNPSSAPSDQGGA